MTRRERTTPHSLHAEIEELFSELWHVPRFAGMRRGFRPMVDSYRTDDPAELTVIVEVPGIDPKSLTIVVSEHTLAIAGERVRERSDGRVYQQMEIEYGPFARQIRLAEDVDPDGATARYEQGIVTITLPIASKPAPALRYSIVVERR
jgi:HSP20 family protein